MKFRYSLLILATFLQATGVQAEPTARYQLPPSKVYIGLCQQQALLRHPGTIEKERMLNRSGSFWVTFEIMANDGSEWLVQCDLANGRIVRDQKLADDNF